MWNLKKDFPIRALKSRYPFNKNIYRNDNKQYAQLYFERYKTVIIDHLDSKYLETFPMTLERNDSTECFTVNLNLVQHKMIFSQKMTKKYGRNVKDDNDGKSKSVYFYTFDLTVGDLLKIYYYKNKYDSDKNKNDNENENPSKEGDDSTQRRNILNKRKQLIERGFKVESENMDLNFLGFLKQGNLFKIPHQEYKISTLDKFLASKIILHDFNNIKFKMNNSDQELTDYLNRSIIELMTEGLLDTLVGYFYFGKNLYNHDNTIYFEKPINMEEFISMIEDDIKTKNYLKQHIFKTCNSRENGILEKFSPQLIQNFKTIPMNMPAYAFRTLLMNQFSYGMVEDLKDQVLDSVQRSKIPKRYRNKQDKCFEEHWKSRLNYGNYYTYDHEYDQIEKDYIKETIAEGQDIALEGDIYTMEESSQIRYAYVLPERIKLEDNNLEAELYKFMSDGEALEHCLKTDEDKSLSLNQKLDQLNLIGYSRVNEPITTYLLVPPDYDVRFKSDFIAYQDFYVPFTDERLPRIVLVTCCEEGETNKNKIEDREN